MNIAMEHMPPLKHSPHEFHLKEEVHFKFSSQGNLSVVVIVFVQFKCLSREIRID